MWKIIQLSTFIAVVYSSIYYGWGADVSGLAVAVVGAFAAFLVTAIPLAIFDLLSRLRIYRDAKRRAITARRQ